MLYGQIISLYQDQDEKNYEIKQNDIFYPLPKEPSMANEHDVLAF